MTATVSDYLLQFAKITNVFGNISDNKYNIYERDWSKFDRENFILNYFSVDWEIPVRYLCTSKKIDKYKLKLKSKPWKSLRLQKPIPVKNKLHVNFINKKDSVLKEEFHTN